MGQAALDDLLRLRVVVGIVALDQRYGLARIVMSPARMPATYSSTDMVRRFAPDEMGVDYGFVVDALGHVECAVVVHVEILFS